MTEALAGRRILITGGGSGIGAAMAHAVAAVGARVLVADLDGAAARATAHDIGKAALWVTTDIRERESLKNAVCLCADHFGGLDVMFNNAGICQIVPFMDLDEAAWREVMDTNALGTLLGTQEAARQMIDQGTGGKIINTGSIAGRQGYGVMAHYSASKFAVTSLTQSAARALAPHKITVNALGPGVVRSPMSERMDAEFVAHGLTAQPGQSIETFAQTTLAGRPTDPADLAGAAVFLASPASDFMTGQTLMIDGGAVLV